MPIQEKLKPLVLLSNPRAGRVERSGSVSVPFIQDKWRRSPNCLAPGNGDLERLKKENERVKIGLRKVRLGLRALQFILAYIVCLEGD